MLKMVMLYIVEKSFVVCLFVIGVIIKKAI